MIRIVSKCLTVRWYCGSNSCTTCIHRELAHSTDDCCRNRISLQDRQVAHHSMIKAVANVSHHALG